MDKQTFQECFKDWLKLKPKSEQAREWRTGIGEIYFKHFGNRRPVELKECLDDMVLTYTYFPSPDEISKELARRAARRTEGGEREQAVFKETHAEACAKIRATYPADQYELARGFKTAMGYK